MGHNWTCPWFKNHSQVKLNKDKHWVKTVEMRKITVINKRKKMKNFRDFYAEANSVSSCGLGFLSNCFFIDLLNSHLSWPKLYFSFFFFSNKVQWMVVFPIENIVRRLFLTWLVDSLFHASFFLGCWWNKW